MLNEAFEFEISNNVQYKIRKQDEIVKADDTIAE